MIKDPGRHLSIIRTEFKEAGDFLFPKKEGAINDAHILAEIGDILLDKMKGRASKEDITLFKSLGLAVEDVAAAHFIYQKLSGQGGGRWIEFNATKKEGFAK